MVFLFGSPRSFFRLFYMVSRFCFKFIYLFDFFVDISTNVIHYAVDNIYVTIKNLTMLVSIIFITTTYLLIKLINLIFTN